MDGWESRRKRTKGHDYIILKLGKPGSIKKVDVDTSHFNGNQPAMISIEGTNSASNKISQFKWKPLLSRKKTNANSHHFFTCLLYTSPSPRDGLLSRMPSSA